MDDFEQQLREALARKEPPAWFEAKVMAAAAREPERRRRWWGDWFAAGRLRWAGAALATVMVAGGIAWERERAAEERAAGEQAKAKLELALRITSAKLRQIEQRVAAVQENNN
jgi:hypothetical protein